MVIFFMRCDGDVFFPPRCDIDYFWRYPTIAIGAIIFPNNCDRLFCEVFLILRFLEFLRDFGVFGVFDGFLRDFEGLWGFEGFLRCNEGYWGFSR